MIGALNRPVPGGLMDAHRDAHRGRSDRRRLLVALGAPLLLAGAGAGVAAAVRSGDEPGPRRVRTDSEPLNRRFASVLGELSEAHWQGYDIDGGAGERTVPGPDSRIRLVGVARLRPGRAAEILRVPDHAFAPAEPAPLPAELERYVPAGAAWRGSARFDAYANRPGTAGGPGGDTGRSGGYLFDAARDLVRFDVVFLYS
ncbi:hypothetical protein AMK16_20445 [Streptomyces sp. CB00455]|nr:hypothetical protein AMK16_20445 [Streptomyces sp. CB00455]